MTPTRTDRTPYLVGDTVRFRTASTWYKVTTSYTGGKIVDIQAIDGNRPGARKYLVDTDRLRMVKKVEA
jgi:hypothetical protein